MRSFCFVVVIVIVSGCASNDSALPAAHWSRETDATTEMGTDLPSPSVQLGDPSLDRPEVGRLENQGRWCTATLITADVILTSSHCVFTPTCYGQADCLHKMAFHVETPGGHHVFPVREVFSLAAVDPRDEQPDPGRDVALLWLIRPVPQTVAVPARLAHEEPQAEQRVTVIGYRCVRQCESGQSTPQKRLANISSLTDPMLACPGDVGGPSFDASGALLRINSSIVRHQTGIALIPPLVDEIEHQLGRWSGLLISSDPCEHLNGCAACTGRADCSFCALKGSCWPAELVRDNCGSDNWFTTTTACPGLAVMPATPDSPVLEHPWKMDAYRTLESSCGLRDTCALCAAQLHCGWDNQTQKCLPGDEIGPYDVESLEEMSWASRPECCPLEGAVDWQSAVQNVVQNTNDERDTGPDSGTDPLDTPQWETHDIDTESSGQVQQPSRRLVSPLRVQWRRREDGLHTHVFSIPRADPQVAVVRYVVDGFLVGEVMSHESDRFETDYSFFTTDLGRAVEVRLFDASMDWFARLRGLMDVADVRPVVNIFPLGGQTYEIQLMGVDDSVVALEIEANGQDMTDVASQLERAPGTTFVTQLPQGRVLLNLRLFNQEGAVQKTIQRTFPILE